MENGKLNANYYFSSGVYNAECQEFKQDLLCLFDEFLHKQKQNVCFNELYPCLMTENFLYDFKAKEFINFINDAAYSILLAQGYKLDGLEATCFEMWGQEHYKMSSMEEHVHGNQAQISGFYFLECPENSSNFVIHDPRSGKKQASLPPANTNVLTDAALSISFIPKENTIYFINSWLPHSFTRHNNDAPLKFIHFNIGLKVKQNNQPTAIIV